MVNRNQMVELFERDVKTIGQYINNALLEELLDQAATVTNFAIVQKEGERSVMRQVAHYNKVKINIQLRLLSKGEEVD